MSILDKQLTPSPRRRSHRRLYTILGIVIILVAILFLFTHVGNDVAFIGHFATPPHHFTYSGHSDYVSAVAWSPDGKRIASARAVDTGQCWNARKRGAVMHTHPGISAGLT